MLDSFLVNEAPPPETNAQPAPTTTLAKTGWTILIAATLGICYFSNLGAIGFVGPDEPRYAWIARAMAETGDWITPRLYGKPWFEKPPLYYWGAAASFKLFGVSEVAARLPCALCALLATLALAWLAWRIYGGETARWLLLLLPTSVGMIGFSHAAATDMPFAAMVTISMVCAAAALRLIPARTSNGQTLAPPVHALKDSVAESAPLSTAPPSANGTPWLALVLFGFFLGLAVLAKGPAGIVLCGGGVFFWAVFTKRWRDAFRLLHPAAIAAFCATALPWYILCAYRNPDFFRVFIIEHNFKRYLTPEFQHIQPFWFYAPVLLVALFPWTILLLWTVFAGLADLRQTKLFGSIRWFLFCWAAFPVLFFTISKSKLPGYVLPAIPPIALIVTRCVLAAFSRVSRARWIFSISGLLLLAAGLLTMHFAMRAPYVTDVRPPQGPVELGIIAAACGAAACAVALFGRPRASLVIAAIAVLAMTTLATGDLWQLDAGISARPAVRGALEHMTPDQINMATVFKLRRAYEYQVDFYLHRETQEWSPMTRADSIIFTDHKNSANLMRLGARCPNYIAFPAVWVCDYSKNRTGLMDHAAGGGEP
ncbi:MAG TPA: glycosyltransferase family 39 protein [Candidatus Acidoferrum sp.]|nr:glycosyltransferase family 39 protein [Candidatus Acidoferrum sp.]